MVAARGFAPPPSIHAELFVTPRSKRAQVRRGTRDLYSVVRPWTEGKGGAGPLLFLLEARPRSRDWPENLRDSLGVRPDEDIWLELAFYPSDSARRRLIRTLWGTARVPQLARRVERLTRRRKGCWTLALGTREPI